MQRKRFERCREGAGHFSSLRPARHKGLGETINRLMHVLDDSRLLEAVEQVKKRTEERMEITEAQKAELKKLSKEARVPDMSETVTTGEEAEKRMIDLKEKARME